MKYVALNPEYVLKNDFGRVLIMTKDPLRTLEPVIESTIHPIHGFSTIKNADQIIAISDGTIKEIGKHEELMNKRGIYYKLMKDQIILE